MKKLAALLLALLASPAAAQNNNLPGIVLPPTSVMGNPQGTTAFVSAVPFSVLTPTLLESIGGAFTCNASTKNCVLGTGVVTGTNIASGTVANSNLATMVGNSIKANTGATIASPTDFGTSTGTPQFDLNSYPPNNPGIDVASGSLSTPITTAGPTIRFSRVENIAPSAGVCNNNFADNECNPTMALYSTATAADGMQNTPLYTAAVSSSTVNAGSGPVGALFTGRVIGAGNGIGTGFIAEGRRDTATGNAIGAQIRATNLTASPGSYNPSGLPTVAGAWITAGPSSGGSPAGVGVALGTAGTTFGVGFGVTTGAVISGGAAFRDDGSTGITLLSRPPTGTSALTLDPVTSAQQAIINFEQTDANKWMLGKNTDNSFFLFDVGGAQNALSVQPSGNMTLSPKGGTTTVTGTLNVTAGYQANGAAGVTQTCTIATGGTLIFTNGILTGGTCNH